MAILTLREIDQAYIILTEENFERIYFRPRCLFSTTQRREAAKEAATVLSQS